MLRVGLAGGGSRGLELAFLGSFLALLLVWRGWMVLLTYLDVEP